MHQWVPRANSCAGLFRLFLHEISQADWPLLGRWLGQISFRMFAAKWGLRVGEMLGVSSCLAPFGVGVCKGRFHALILSSGGTARGLHHSVNFGVADELSE